MSSGALDRRPARTSAILAATVAVVVVTVVGWGAGVGWASLLAVIGSVLLAVGARAVEEPARTRQAGGSIAATAGAAVLFALIALASSGRGGLILVALSVGLALIAVDAAIGFEWERVRGLTSVMAANGKFAVVGIFLTAGVYLVFTFAPPLFGGVLAVSTLTPLAGFVSLQLFALCVAFAIPRAVSVLEWWVSDDGDAGADSVLDSVEAAGLRPSDVPRVYWFALAVQLVAAFTPQGNELFGLFFGGVLALPLTSGVLHGFLGAILLVLLAIFVAAALRWWIIAWLGAVPAQTFAVQAGGVTSILVTVLAGLLLEYLPDSRLVNLFAPRVVVENAIIGVPAIALGVLAVAVLVVALLLEVGPAVARLGFAPVRTTGFALGSTLLFLAALAAAPAGAPAFVVFVGVAGALLTWDVGSHASSVGLQLGQAAVTRRSEFVHASGTALVLGGAVVVATLASYVVVPAMAPAGTQETSGRAALSLILVLFALLAFVVAVHLRGRATGS